MRPPMYHTAYRVVTTANAYGDKVASGTVAYKCHVRIINEAVTASNDETTQCDAMFWFEPDTPVVKNAIWKFQGEHYRVERIIEARKLRNPQLQFIKVEMLKYGQIS